MYLNRALSCTNMWTLPLPLVSCVVWPQQSLLFICLPMAGDVAKSSSSGFYHHASSIEEKTGLAK